MSLNLKITGDVIGFESRLVGRLTRTSVPENERKNCFLAINGSASPSETDLQGYYAILSEGKICPSLTIPDGMGIVTGVETLSAVSSDTVVAVAPGSRSIHLLYRPESEHNALFLTNQCNSRCLMCSQPPTNGAEPDTIGEHIRTIELIREAPEWLGITGGEPTLLGDSLLTVINSIRLRLPGTRVQLLTNARLLADSEYAEALASSLPVGSIVGIPLYSDDAETHDFVVQAKGAFDETVRGIYNLARAGIAIEVRFVLHKASIPRLRQTCEFLYRNMAFLSHIALMGLENMGYVKRNWDEVWIDPIDYAEELQKCVRFFYLRRMPVSIYNLPLCVLPRSLWCFARKSISDHKNIYLSACRQCEKREECGGFFKSSEERHSRGISPIIASTIV